VNEEEAELRVTEYGEYYLVYTFPPALEIQPITSVSVTLDAPAVGARPDYTAEFPSGAHYYSNEFAEWGYLNDIIWRDMTDEVYLLPGTDVFLAGHSYQVTVYLTAEYGYTFPSEDEISAALNGIDVSCNVLFGQLNLSCVVPPLADVTRGDVNLDGKVDAADLTVLARHVAGISFLTDPQALSNADVTGEGGISASDLTKLARFVAHIEDEL
ncbi:MAG: dockerin type I repeat-containing protein, partial [Firmicutes bacterium]|nr:dockerin type I repeat-containing protein [Bacillota bacterium]